MMRLGSISLGSVAAALLLCADRAGAQPTCAVGTIESYVGLGADGCTYGGLTFRGIEGYAWQHAGFPSQPIASSLAVTPFTRTIAGQDYVGLSLTRVGGLSASTAAALLGGDTCDHQCYRAGTSVRLDVQVEGDAFTGTFGLGRIFPRTVAATGTDWLVSNYEQIAAYSGLTGLGAVGRQETAGAFVIPMTCGAGVFPAYYPMGCDPDAIVVQAPVFPLYSATVQLVAVTLDGVPLTGPPQGEGSVSTEGAEFLFGVRAPSTTAPEPTSLTLAGIGLALTGAWTRRRVRRRV